MNFYEPVVFAVKVVAGEAMASFEAINGELKRLEMSSLKAGAALGSVGKGAMIAKAGFVAAGLAAAAFGTYAVRASMENEVAMNKLQQVLKTMGDTSAATYNQINTLANSMTNLGFSDNVVMDSMSTLITATGNVADATHLNAVAMDMARFKHIGLAEASSALAKGTQGNARAFKEFGITLDASLPRQEAINKALTQLQEKMGGQAQAYTKSLAGKIEVLHAKFELMAENIGNVIIPILDKFVSAIYLVGKVLAAVFGPMARFVQANSTAFLTFFSIIAGGVIAWKAYTAAVWLGDLALKAYTYTQMENVGVTNALNAAYVRLRMTMAFNPFLIWAVALAALAAGFVVAWNRSETFRKVVVEGMKGAVMAVGYLIKAFGWLAETLLKIETGPLKLLLKGLSALGFGPAKTALKELDSGIKSVGTFFDKAGNKVQDFADKLDGLKNKKIPIPKFSLGGTDSGSASREDAFNLTNYTGAGAKAAAAKVAKTLMDQLQEEFKKQVAPDIGNMFSALLGVDANGNLTVTSQGAIKTSVQSWGDKFGKGVDGLIASMKDKLAKAKNLWKDTNELLAQGFAPDFVQSIIAQGAVVGDQMAQLLLKSSPTQRLAVQGLYSDLGKVGATAVNGAGNNLVNNNVTVHASTNATAPDIAQAALYSLKYGNPQAARGHDR